MCCFSGPAVVHVSRTRIFARASSEGRQILAYGMTVTADDDVAMILPLPVPNSASEQALHFISLDGYEGFFDDVERGFPRGWSFGATTMDSLPDFTMPGLARAPLTVHDVGLFEASFVPNIDAFARLDSRFRIPDVLWETLPAYRSYGFAVFRLKGFGDGATAGRDQTKTVHPMAFEFERNDPSSLFFPTVHIHDGELHPLADFDHTLYAQARSSEVEGAFARRGKSRPPSPLAAWSRSDKLASRFVDVTRAQSIVDGELFCYRTQVHETRANEDTFVPL